VLVERSVMEQRYPAVLEVQAGVPVVDVARRFWVSRQAVHRWKSRYQCGGLQALADRSKRPRAFITSSPELSGHFCSNKQSIAGPD
jgi:transposase